MDWNSSTRSSRGTFLTLNGPVPGQTVHIRWSTTSTLSVLFFGLTTTKPTDHYGCTGLDLKIDAKSVLQDEGLGGADCDHSHVPLQAVTGLH
jgi:hypothetical protein